MFKSYKNYWAILVLILSCFQSIAQEKIPTKPKISFTFDDGSVKDMPNYALKEWNQMILNHLETHQTKAIFFITSSFLPGEKGQEVIRSWNDAGHKIGNHTFSHPYFNSKKINLEQFELDFLKNDSLIKSYSNFYPYFRFPYLKEGDTPEKIEGFRAFLKEQGYKNAHVTIDASDWYVNQRLLKRLETNSTEDLSAFKKFYIEHLYERAMFYDSLALELTGRQINHTILLHHNLAAALFLGDLISYFKEKDWEIIDADKAYQDPIFENHPTPIPAGESLIWALAKQSERFEKVLRYPGEDSKYEKEKMDRLGL